MRAEGGFWARRRAAVAAEEAQEAEATCDRVPEAPAEERSEEEILAELGLPDPDALRPGDDFAAFMSRAVPEAIRRRALRRLWSSRPVLANLDGLVDYDDDFTGGGVEAGTLPTAYRVGRGLIREAERLAEGSGAEPEEAPAPASADPTNVAGAMTGTAAPEETHPEPPGGAPASIACENGAAGREEAGASPDGTEGRDPAPADPRSASAIPVATARRHMLFEFRGP